MGEAPGSPPSGSSRLYPPCFLLSLVKMESMFSTSRRGLHAGRHLPEPARPEQLVLDSLLASASQSRGLLEELGVVLLVGEVVSERKAGEDEKEEEECVRLWMMMLIVSLKSRRRLMEDGLRRRRGTCCSFKVSPGGGEIPK